jgi:hypothetical protein
LLRPMVKYLQLRIGYFMHDNNIYETYKAYSAAN